MNSNINKPASCSTFNTRVAVDKSTIFGPLNVTPEAIAVLKFSVSSAPFVDAAIGVVNVKNMFTPPPLELITKPALFCSPVVAVAGNENVIANLVLGTLTSASVPGAKVVAPALEVPELPSISNIKDSGVP